MSLLYECISGIIQGGILSDPEPSYEGDEVAELCVSKLRGMIMVEGDPNCTSLPTILVQNELTREVKYVALLAFKKIVVSHPTLVALHQDAILDCIDDADISVRLLALQLSSRMINSENLRAFVDRLMEQLKDAATMMYPPLGERQLKSDLVGSSADPNNETVVGLTLEESNEPRLFKALSNEYCATAVQQILNMCCRDGYANVLDFKWYVTVLMELVHVLPLNISDISPFYDPFDAGNDDITGIAVAVGKELQSIAVRVASARSYTVEALSTLMDPRQRPNNGSCSLFICALEFAAWTVGEYACDLRDPRHTLDLLMLPLAPNVCARVLCAYLLAVPKVLAVVLSTDNSEWDTETQAKTLLVLTKVVNFMGSFVDSPDIEVQERSVSFLELLRVCSQATETHPVWERTHGPLILSKALPSLFGPQELKPMAAIAQKRVPVPQQLQLMVPINRNLEDLLQKPNVDGTTDPETTAVQHHYYTKANDTSRETSVNTILGSSHASSYQETNAPVLHSSEAWVEEHKPFGKNQYEPFYIHHDSRLFLQPSSHVHDILQHDPKVNKDEIESIPILQLDVGAKDSFTVPHDDGSQSTAREVPSRVHVAAEETFNDSSEDFPDRSSNQPWYKQDGNLKGRSNSHKPLLQVDSSGLETFTLFPRNGPATARIRPEMENGEEDELSRALAQIEKKRLEMQRASDRVQVAHSIPTEGALVTKKQRRKKEREVTEHLHPERPRHASTSVKAGNGAGSAAKPKKRRRKPRGENAAGVGRDENISTAIR